MDDLSAKSASEKDADGRASSVHCLIPSTYQHLQRDAVNVEDEEVVPSQSYSIIFELFTSAKYLLLEL
jgi:hypothetical protein